MLCFVIVAFHRHLAVYFQMSLVSDKQRVVTDIKETPISKDALIICTFLLLFTSSMQDSTYENKFIVFLPILFYLNKNITTSKASIFQRVHDVYTTSHQCRCNVMTLHRR